MAKSSTNTSAGTSASTSAGAASGTSCGIASGTSSGGLVRPASGRSVAMSSARARRSDRSGWAVLSGAVAMTFVGGSVAVSGLLQEADLSTAQGLRYAMACLLLVLFARLSRRRVLRPRGAEWLWLAGVAGSGLVVFNVALVRGSSHAEPAVLGVAVACVPLVLAVAGPVLEGRRPRQAALVAAVVVTCGAVLVQGTGRADAAGLAWAVVVLACEAAFTLLAVPVLGRHGPWGVSVHTTWIAAATFGVFSVATQGAGAVLRLEAQELLAAGYLAVAVTAVAFVLWYTSVARLGAGRAGLLTGIAPVAAAAGGVLLGGAVPQLLVWVGVAVVVAGLVLGMASAPATAPTPVPALAPPTLPDPPTPSMPPTPAAPLNSGP